MRLFWLLAILFLSLRADELLFEKIQSIIETKTFEENRAFIEIIFSPYENYYHNERIDTVKVIETLKENGLLNLFFESPRELEITFSTNGQPLFFVKLMSDVLRSMGYYRYVTEESKLDESAFKWKIKFTSEYATDPTMLRSELNKRGCDIIDIVRSSAQQWHYEIDISLAHLDLKQIKSGEEITFKRSLDSHWLAVSEVKRLDLWSLKENNWYPYVAFYDSSLRLLKVYKRDRKTRQISLSLPRDTAYVKVGDLYSLKNIKDGLRIQAQGVK